MLVIADINVLLIKKDAPTPARPTAKKAIHSFLLKWYSPAMQAYRPNQIIAIVDTPITIPVMLSILILLCLATLVYSSPYFLLGFRLAWPFSTLSCCHLTSKLLQIRPAPNTPTIVAKILLRNTETPSSVSPINSRASQTLLPKWYSIFTTIGWNNPIAKNAIKPIKGPL